MKRFIQSCMFNILGYWALVHYGVNVIATWLVDAFTWIILLMLIFGIMLYSFFKKGLLKIVTLR